MRTARPACPLMVTGPLAVPALLGFSAIRPANRFSRTPTRTYSPQAAHRSTAEWVANLQPMRSSSTLLWEWKHLTEQDVTAALSGFDVCGPSLVESQQTSIAILALRQSLIDCPNARDDLLRAGIMPRLIQMVCSNTTPGASSPSQSASTLGDIAVDLISRLLLQEGTTNPEALQQVPNQGQWFVVAALSLAL